MKIDTLIILFFFVSCSGGSIVNKAALFPLKTIADPMAEEIEWHPWQVIPEREDLKEIVVYDSLLISYVLPQSGHFMEIYSMNTGKKLGDFVLHGRSPQEMIQCLSRFSMIENDNGVASLLYDFPTGRFMVWNITSSLEQGITQFSRSYLIHPDPYSTIPATSSFLSADHRKLILYDSGETVKSDRMVKAPTILQYDTRTGVMDSIILFKVYNYTKDSQTSVFESVPAKGIFSSRNCYNPATDRMCLALNYFPTLLFVDGKDGVVRGVSLSGLKESDASAQYWSFYHVASSTSEVFLLYSGDAYGGNHFACRVLYVFDWEGNVLKKYHLPEEVFSISYDAVNQRLYFFNLAQGKIWYKDDVPGMISSGK